GPCEGAARVVELRAPECRAHVGPEGARRCGLCRGSVRGGHGLRHDGRSPPRKGETATLRRAAGSDQEADGLSWGTAPRSRPRGGARVIADRGRNCGAPYLVPLPQSAEAAPQGSVAV